MWGLRQGSQSVEGFRTCRAPEHVGQGGACRTRPVPGVVWGWELPPGSQDQTDRDHRKGPLGACILTGPLLSDRVTGEHT